MQPLIGCGESLVALIQTQYRDWSFIYSIVENWDLQISNTPHAHPIPYGTEITDHVKRGMDRLTLTGVVGCLGCDGESDILHRVIPETKRLSERMIYSRENFVTIAMNFFDMRHMMLESANFNGSHKKVQIMNVTTTWLGVNLSGTIRNPSFERGGIVH